MADGNVVLQTIYSQLWPIPLHFFSPDIVQEFSHAADFKYWWMDRWKKLPTVQVQDQRKHGKLEILFHTTLDVAICITNSSKYV